MADADEVGARRAAGGREALTIMRMCGFTLNPCNPHALAEYMLAHGWLEPGERIAQVSRAGDGNMNLTLRVQTARRSVIVKQGRPWVEKYPSIPAPEDRTLGEADWYECVRAIPALARRIPRVLGLDRTDRVLVLSDLGDRGDFTDLYTGRRLAASQLDALIDWLATLHHESAGDRRAQTLENHAMRTLNHEHIFEVPLRADNGLDLDAITPGLSATARELAADRRLIAAISALGERYLGPGSTLLHGDYYPGSWLQAPEPWVIDPEFGFYGPPEFDVGVLLAHLRLSGQPADLSRRALGRYLSVVALDPQLALGYAGVEVIRRLLGVSQLPLALDLDGKCALLAGARTLVGGIA